MTSYEKDRLSRMKRNEVVLEAYGVRKLAASLKEIARQNSMGEENSRKDRDEEDEYDPEKEAEVDSDEELEVPKYL